MSVANDEVIMEVAADRGCVRIILVDATDAQMSVIFTPTHLRELLPLFVRAANCAEAQMPRF